MTTITIDGPPECCICHDRAETARDGKYYCRACLSKQIETINHPSHYSAGGIEAIDVIEAWDLGFHLGNTIKYIARAGRKGDRLEDLKKAAWYLDREIGRTETSD